MKTSLWTPCRITSHVGLAVIFCLAIKIEAAAPSPNPWQVDFRYQPPFWQTAIGLPDDWQKTLVSDDGALLYDYPGSFSGFGMKITAGLAEGVQRQSQELHSPRVPLVRTIKRGEGVEVAEEAFAVAPPIPARGGAKNAPALERLGRFAVSGNWANPPAGTDPAFRSIAVGYGEPVHYRFPAKKSERFTVIFGLCEGWHTNAGRRMLELVIEGRARQTVDMIAEHGRNKPAVFALPANDENKDGWINVAVAAASNSADKNAILNVLWVFREGDAPESQQLLAGQSSKPPLLHLECGSDPLQSKPPRHDMLLMRVRNSKPDSQARVTPILTVETGQLLTPNADRRQVLAGASTSLHFPQPYEQMEKSEGRTVFFFAPTQVPTSSELTLPFCVARGEQSERIPRDTRHAESLKKETVKFWEKLDLPYDRIQLPDAGIQALVDSSIRNIYQAREIKKGLPAFQVGPTCYRGLWVVDGSFILESIALLGRTQEARDGIQYLLSFQREDGSFMLIDGHWKETGIVLWAVTRHARLTGDVKWLREVWPKLERGFTFIRKMRGMAPAGAPNAGLVPDGFSDGGLPDRVPEYTNIYWTLAGMRAALEAARWMGENATAEAWQKEYDDFLATFRRAAARDMRKDAKGNQFIPIRMARNENVPPQKAQWAFCHAVYPGKIFAANDPLVLGNMAMLKAVESEGLVLDTGWLKDGIWNYFASFYGHAWLWLGNGSKAAETLYHFGNHASPLLCWREEQMPQGKGRAVVGDMPHNWASAEFLRLTRNCLVLERGDELHLFEALPPAWIKPGAVTRLEDVATEFGPLTLELRVGKKMDSATLHLKVPRRSSPRRVVLHLDNWSGQAGEIDLAIKGSIRQEIKLLTPASRRAD